MISQSLQKQRQYAGISLDTISDTKVIPISPNFVFEGDFCHLRDFSRNNIKNDSVGPWVKALGLAIWPLKEIEFNATYVSDFVLTPQKNYFVELITR